MDIKLDPESEDLTSTVDLHRHPVSPEQMRWFERYAAEIFSAFGLDLNTAATRQMPRRFIGALFDSTEGYDGDPKFMTIVETACRGGPDCHSSQVIEGPIPFFALCEHHALPFHGRAYVGYVAHEHLIGLSKLTRLVRLFARRFTIQERIGQQVAHTLESMLKPHGVADYLEARHLCTEMRGVRETATLTQTAFWRGRYDSEAALRAEFLAICGAQLAAEHARTPE